MNRLFTVFYTVLLGFAMVFSALATSEELKLSSFEQGMIGTKISYFQEQEGRPLPLAEAVQRFAQNEATASSGDAISLGIGVRPVWLKTTINNDYESEKFYRLSVETPWLDYIDTYLVHDNQVVNTIQGGDAYDFDERPMQYRYYAFETQFAPGKTDVYIRVDSAGPMAIPVRLAEVPLARARDIATGYEYGILYGIMLALGLYNLLLYLSIRLPEFGLYSFYLFGFVINSVSYTGQIHTVLTPDLGPYFQDWLDISLMITYSILGLHFARVVLKTKEYAPKLDKFVVWFTIVIPVGMVFGAIVNSLFFSMILAFILNTSFAFLFIIMGYRALKADVPNAWLFFISSVTAATCICISTAAVAGLLPYNDVTFKLIEVGMAFEAILLAVLLAQRFREAQQGKITAETHARTDDLTHLFNRRGFRDTADIIWQQHIREQRDVSVILLDIDRFKSINDTYGHATGDLVLSEIAKCIEESARKSDVTARWGGEEFILMLPETEQHAAVLQAERLRLAIEGHQVHYAGETLKITASIGVAGTNEGHFDGLELGDIGIERMINKADEALYEAKRNGRNQVHASHAFSKRNLFTDSNPEVAPE